MGSYSDPYDWEDDEPSYPGRHSISRDRRRPSFVDAPTVIPDSNIGYGSNRFAPGSLPTEYALGRTYNPSSSPRYPPTPFQGTNYTPSIVVSNMGAPNNAPPQVYQLPRGDPSLNGALVPASSFGRARSSSFSYPQQYPNQPMQPSYGNPPYGYPQGVQPGQTIVIQQPPKKHRHRQRHRHRSRSR